MHLFHHQATRRAHPATRHCRADMSSHPPNLESSAPTSNLTWCDSESQDTAPPPTVSFTTDVVYDADACMLLLISCARSGIAAFSCLYMYVGQYSGQVPLLKHIQLLMAETENNKNIEASPV